MHSAIARSGAFGAPVKGGVNLQRLPLGGAALQRRPAMAAPPVYRPVVAVAGIHGAAWTGVPASVQAKAGMGAPAVYRPAATPVSGPAACLLQRPSAAQRTRTGVAPAVYRPAAATTGRPEVYRPWTAASAQRKARVGAPPVYRPTQSGMGAGTGRLLPRGGFGTRAIQPYTTIMSGKAKLSSGGEVIVMGKELFATSGKIREANRELAQAGPHGSMIKLEKAGVPKKTKDAEGKEFFPVKPTLNYTAYRERMDREPTSFHVEMRAQGEDRLQIWADCRRAAEVVTGASSGMASYEGRVKIGGRLFEGYTGGIKRKNDVANDSKTARLSFQVYTTGIPTFLEKYDYNPKLFREELTKDRSDEQVISFAKKNAKIAANDIAMAERLYSSLSERAKLEFHKLTGTNEYANPGVGSAYSTVTEYGMPGFDEPKKGIWPLHWAGVVMKDGTDNVTLENYSEGDESLRNGKWQFEMYGTEKPEQSFHREHMKSGLHGNVGTTMVVETAGSDINRKLTKLREQVEGYQSLEQGMGVDYRPELLAASVKHNKFAEEYGRSLLTERQVLGMGRSFTNEDKGRVHDLERRWIPF